MKVLIFASVIFVIVVLGRFSPTSILGADIIAASYSTLGIFGGLTLEGSVLARRNDFNEAYYAAGASPRGIVIEGKFTNPATGKLKAAIGAM